MSDKELAARLKMIQTQRERKHPWLDYERLSRLWASKSVFTTLRNVKRGQGDG